jgi:hypothetical protein
MGKAEGENTLEEQGVDGRIILNWIFTERDGVIDWIDPAQDRDRWWIFVNAVMNFQIP